MLVFGNIADTLKTATAAFRKDEAGSVVPIVAVSLIAMATAAGAALDYSRLARVKTQTDAAVDAATLAVGAAMQTGEMDESVLRKTFDDILSVNLGNSDYSQSVEIENFQADLSTGAVTARVKGTLPMTLMNVAGIQFGDVVSDVEAVFRQTETDVAVMLDVTGSMGGQKLVDLKRAASNAVDILLTEQRRASTRVGLVPYADMVNVGFDMAQRVSEGQAVRPALGCVTERTGAQAATDAYYQPASLGADPRVVNVPTRCPNAQLVPLSNNRDTLKDSINLLNADGFTAGHMGIAWSYYMLSDEWGRQGAWPASATPLPGAKKIAILMTDGSFNTAYDGVVGDPRGNGRAQSAALSRALCENMKDDGITVFSVAFQAPDDAKQILLDCANPAFGGDQFFFNASNGAELNAAFEAIAERITSLTLTR